MWTIKPDVCLSVCLSTTYNTQQQNVSVDRTTTSLVAWQMKSLSRSVWTQPVLFCLHLNENSGETDIDASSFLKPGLKCQPIELLGNAAHMLTNQLIHIFFPFSHIILLHPQQCREILQRKWPVKRGEQAAGFWALTAAQKENHKPFLLRKPML